MSYVNINTLEKLEAVDIMVANPEVSFPNRGWNDEELEPYGYAELNMPSDHPIPGMYEKLVEGTPKKIDGKWYIQFVLAPMTEEEKRYKNELIRREIVMNTQSSLDNFAQSRGYDNILSLTTYVTSTNATYRIEAERGVELRDATWSKLYEIQEQIESGTRSVPASFLEIQSELPALVWE